MSKVRVAMIGVGNISGIYLKNIHERYTEIELLGVCDLVKERAQKAQAEYPNLKIYDTMFDAFNDPDVEVVLNLTRPAEHFEVSKQALLHGKHVYSEKPLAASIELGKELVAIAEEKGLYLGGAPDTFLGAGLQTCRKLIDEGAIGRVLGVNAHMISHGMESWHPDCEFFYKFGGGPIMDMGPYYITALVSLLGRVKETTGMTKASFETRTVTAKEQAGKVISVEVPTYVDGVMMFESGAVGRMLATFDAYYPKADRIEIFGTEGTLIAPDPNFFSGPVQLVDKEGKVTDMELVPGYTDNSRGLGLWDMCASIRAGVSPRAGYQQTRHVLEIMTSFERASRKKGFETIETPYERPRPMNDNYHETGRII